VEHDGDAEIVPGVRVVTTPGHTPGHQSVLVDTDDGLVVVGGDVAYKWPDFDASESGQKLLALWPRRIWLAHEAEPRDL
jgi:N-acyl homoserine lactone hydrolase